MKASAWSAYGLGVVEAEIKPGRIVNKPMLDERTGGLAPTEALSIAERFLAAVRAAE